MVDTEYVATVGSRLKALRQERGLKIAAVAEELNIGASGLSLIERGKQELRLTQLHRAVEFYGVDANQLLGTEPRSFVDTEKGMIHNVTSISIRDVMRERFEEQ